MLRSINASDPTRLTALVAGLLYLLTFASSIPAAVLLSPVLTNPAYIASPGVDSQISLAALLDLVNGFAAIGTALALFTIVKRQHEGFALGFVATRLFEAGTLAIGILCMLAVVTPPAGRCDRHRHGLARRRRPGPRRRPRLGVRRRHRDGRLQRPAARHPPLPLAAGAARHPRPRPRRGADLPVLRHGEDPRGGPRGGDPGPRGRADLRLGALGRAVDDVQGLPGRRADRHRGQGRGVVSGSARLRRRRPAVDRRRRRARHDPGAHRERRPHRTGRRRADGPCGASCSGRVGVSPLDYALRAGTGRDTAISPTDRARSPADLAPRPVSRGAAPCAIGIRVGRRFASGCCALVGRAGPARHDHVASGAPRRRRHVAPAGS